MKLEDTIKFAILLQNEFADGKVLCNIVRKVSSRQHVSFNTVTVDGGKAFIIYNVDEKYLFNMATNKKLKMIWKNEENFYLIDFSNSTKGDIISHLTFTEISRDKIEGKIMYENVKPDFTGAGKILTGITLKGKNGITVRLPVLDDAEPYTFENFYFYYKNDMSVKC